MQSIQKLGGISALVAAGTFLVGLVMLVTVFMDYVSAADTSEAIAFIADHQLSLHVWNITIMIVFGIVLNIADSSIAALHASDPEMASTVWTGLGVVTNGLGGGNEVLGGVWVLGTSIVALRERLFARWTNYLGVVMGVAGLVTVVPALEDVGAVFGLGLIIWFVAVGISLMKDGSRSAEQPSSPRLPVARAR